MVENSEQLSEGMNNGEDTSILLVRAIELLESYERKFYRLIASEKDKLRILDENNELKMKIGEFVVVKNLMNSAKQYGYADLIKFEKVDDIFKEAKLLEKRVIKLEEASL